MSQIKAQNFLISSDTSAGLLDCSKKRDFGGPFHLCWALFFGYLSERRRSIQSVGP